MKILFCMRHQGYLRNFEAPVRLLAEQGHRLHFLFEPFVGEEKQKLLEQQVNPVIGLSREYPNISYGVAPSRDDDGWSIFGQKVRAALDYLRYLEPTYRHAPKLQARARLRAPWLMRQLASTPVLRTSRGRRLCRAVLRLIYQSLPTSKQIDTLIREFGPDIVLVTPLIEISSPQADYIRSARALGIRTGLCVASWDNLTNKGLIHDVPDLVTVWNDAMKREAVDLHQVPPERVVVTGSPAYDHWFSWRPSTTREQFCERVGLPVDRPYILYLCSSSFIAPNEAPFVLEWLRRLRAHDDPIVREAGVLIRPHPQNAAQWQSVDVSSLVAVAIWPRAGADPTDDQARSDYFDSLYHSAAVVGVNTSALIESAIVGRSVHTLLSPEFRDTQEGTLHFHHLLHVNGGLLHTASTFEEHARQLARALKDPLADADRDRRFIEGFIRPYGLDVPAAPKLVAAVLETCARGAPQAQPRPVWALPVQVLFAPAASFVRWRVQRLKSATARRQEVVA